MSDLISRADAVALAEDIETKRLKGEIELTYAPMIKGIMNLPSAERKGRWEITDAYPHNVYCSECHKRFAQTHWAVWEDGSLPRAYCPNCGADMRERRQDETD